MKTALMYYYNLESPTIYRTGQKIYIKNNNSRYILEPVPSVKELNEIYTMLTNYTISQLYYEIVKTKSGMLTIKHNGMDYVLLKINKNNMVAEARKSKKIQLPNNNYLLDRSNWYFLWCKKNDYIEYHAKHIEKKYKIIDESIDYYLGMAETAISYIKNNKDINNSNQLTLAHRRINNVEINNPLNIIVDTKERDISEYLKYLFINNQQNIKKIKQILSIYDFKKIEMERLYARLLYPNYYFDMYEKVVNNYESEQKINEITKRVNEYESFLRDIYSEIIKQVKIKKVEWL